MLLATWGASSGGKQRSVGAGGASLRQRVTLNDGPSDVDRQAVPHTGNTADTLTWSLWTNTDTRAVLLMESTRALSTVSLQTKR